MQLRSIATLHQSSLTLENETALAGRALGCAYSSSDEFEAEIIVERRAAGMYRASPWPAIAAGAMLVAIVVVALSQF